MRMRAPILRAPRERLAVEEVEIDDPQPGEVRIKMAAAGVCHSCLYAWDGSSATQKVPVVLGDEGAGTVEAVGPGVDSVAPGDRVIVAWTPTCGRCHYCAIGRPNLCERRTLGGLMRDGTSRMRVDGTTVYHYGGVATYGSYTVVQESQAIRIPDAMPLEKSALIGCSVMTGVGAVLNTARVEAGESLAVFGCGGVGLNAVQGGRIAGAAPLIAVDVADNKLAYARQMGATHAINAATEDAPARIREITGRGADYTVAVAGVGKATEQAWESLAIGGTCVVVSAGTPEIRIPGGSLVLPERTLKGSCYGSARPREDFLRLVNLYLSGVLKIDELITKTYSIQDATEAFEDLEQGHLARGLIVFR